MATYSDMDYITVQQLSSNVEGRYQKYARIGALSMVPLGCEPMISNKKEACKRFFKAEDMECDILVNERSHRGLRRLGSRTGRRFVCVLSKGAKKAKCARKWR